MENIVQQKVKVYPDERYAVHKGRHINKIIGYVHFSIEEIAGGITKIKEGISNANTRIYHVNR